MKNTNIKRGIAALAAVAGVAAIGLIGASPASAHAPINYIADCPTNQYNEDATWQQLVIQNWSGSAISVTAWENYPNGNITALGNTGSGQTGGQVTYFTPQDGDVVRYDITSAGDLNYFYHVDCFY